MFGFVVGTLCLIALIKVVKHHHHGHHGWGGGRTARRRWHLRWAFRRLATTPAQEKVILEAADHLDAQREKLFDELRAAKSDLAEALKGASFDEARFRAAFERQQTVLTQLQDAVLESAKKVHEVLQPDQRKTIADALEYGPRAMHGGGCCCGGYRTAEAC